VKKVFLAISIIVALIVIGFGGLFVYVRAQQRSYAELEDTKDLEQRIAALATNYLAKRTNGGLVVGILQGGKQHVQGFGRTGPTNASPPDGQTIYEIGSITKVFTAIALAQAAEDGLLKLDERISGYLPQDVILPEGKAREITFTHLATHSSGLPRLPQNFFAVVGNDPNPYIRYEAAHMYDALRKVEVKELGKKADYSNFGFGLLGHLIELRSGKSYEALLRERIFIPLGLTNTAVGLSPEQRARLIPCFDSKGRSASNWDFNVMAGAGAIRSTAEDVLKFLKANLEPETTPIAAALRKCQQRYIEDLSGGARLGWQVTDTIEGLRIFWHNGGTAGYYSFAAFDPKHKTAVVLLSNYGDAFANDHSIDKIALNILTLASKVSLSGE
jgi:serine-type D-Ala-D-Ala carboxypeptidase/endopeptidase